jgi:hypothetical protein
VLFRQQGRGVHLCAARKQPVGLYLEWDLREYLRVSTEADGSGSRCKECCARHCRAVDPRWCGSGIQAGVLDCNLEHRILLTYPFALIIGEGRRTSGGGPATVP